MLGDGVEFVGAIAVGDSDIKCCVLDEIVEGSIDVRACAVGANESVICEGLDVRLDDDSVVSDTRVIYV